MRNVLEQMKTADDLMAGKPNPCRFVSSQFTVIYYSWRPAPPDAGDDLVIDCAMNANAMITTFNLRDFRNARESLGLQGMPPAELITKLTLEGNQKN